MAFVDASIEVFVIWLLLGMNLVFLAGRLYLRGRQFVGYRGYRLSDYLIIWTFFLILTENIIITYFDIKEIRFRQNNPFIPEKLDVISIPQGYSLEDKVVYAKQLYALIILNLFTVWSVKAALLSFFYEVFPLHLRRILHLCSSLVAAAFAASLLESIFWCIPQDRMWIFFGPNRCSLKLDSQYNSTQFAMHFSSTAIVIILPVLLLGRVGWKRRELGFAFSTLGFGILSLGASSAAYVTLRMLRYGSIDPHIRHCTLLSSVGDQNAIFLAACLSVVRVSLRRMDDPSLVIEVRKSWSVDVEIVEAWGYNWQDPWHRSDPSLPEYHDGSPRKATSSPFTIYNLSELQIPKSIGC